MIKDLRDAFTSMLAGVTWMDETTRKLAIAKVWRNIVLDLDSVCACVCVCSCERVR